MRIYLTLLFPLILAACAPELKVSKIPVTPGYDELGAVEAFYGLDAKNRVHAWRQLLSHNKEQPVAIKLKQSNDFFNHLKFEDDFEHWATEDYWATPIETIATNGGDCEDFAIGKYFTLTALGVPEQCLKITYVKALKVHKAHMVLNYQCNARDDALILDNLVTAILPAMTRTDLVPVYSFNANGLWLAARRHSGIQVSSGENISRWQNLLQRVDKPLQP